MKPTTSKKLKAGLLLGLAVGLASVGWGLFYLSRPIPTPDWRNHEVGPDIHDDKDLLTPFYKRELAAVERAMKDGSLSHSSQTELSCDRQTRYQKDLWTRDGKPVAYRVTRTPLEAVYRISGSGLSSTPSEATAETGLYSLSTGQLFAFSIESEKTPANDRFFVFSQTWSEFPRGRVQEAKHAYFVPMQGNFWQPLRDFSMDLCSPEARQKIDHTHDHEPVLGH